jgi:hypothetical protein
MDLVKRLDKHYGRKSPLYRYDEALAYQKQQAKDPSRYSEEALNRTKSLHDNLWNKLNTVETELAKVPRNSPRSKVLYKRLEEVGNAASNATSNLRHIEKARELLADFPNVVRQKREWQKANPAPWEFSPHTPEQFSEFKKGLPGWNIDALPQQDRASFESAVDSKKKTMHVVPGGRGSDWPILWHEYSHAVDPVMQSPLAQQGYQFRPMNYEPEIPAMVVERQTAASPYALPQFRENSFSSPMEKQIQKFGPQMTGNIRRDQGTVQNWMQSLRRVPGAQLQAKKPFAYHGDTRTPEQRAQALGTSYQNWMNYQAGQ